MKRYDCFVSIDKLRVCMNMPDGLYGYLMDHYTRHDRQTNNRILDEDDFTLTSAHEERVYFTRGWRPHSSLGPQTAVLGRKQQKPRPRRSGLFSCHYPYASNVGKGAI